MNEQGPVTLRDLDQRFATLMVEIRRIDGDITALAELQEERRRADTVAVSERRASDSEAISLARNAADATLVAHNGLLKKLDDQAEATERQRISEVATFARKDVIEQKDRESDKRFKRLESFHSKLLGGLAVIGAIGIANFVQIWVN